jgi:hypothetical protein
MNLLNYVLDAQAAHQESMLNTLNLTVYFQITHLHGLCLATLVESIDSMMNQSTSNHKVGCLQKIVDVAADSLHL